MLHIDFHACAPPSERGAGAFFFADLQNSNVKRLSCQIFRPAASILTAAVPYSDIPLPHRIRQGQQIVLQFIRIPINWRFILWKYGYIRVSTKEQNEQRQLIAMREFGIAENRVYMDKQSGKDFERKNYKRLIRKLKKDDTLVVKSIDRLGRKRI